MKSASLRHALKLGGFLLGLPLGVSACSGESTPNSDGTGGSGGAGGTGSECSSAFGPIDPTALIDDMEDANALVATTASRNGSWWVVSDGTASGTIQPPSDQAPPPERVPGGHCGSNYAMRVTGQGFTNWGALISAGFRYTSQAESIDASAFRGVMFWARTGDTNSSAVRVQFQDASTRPEGGKCNPVDGTPDACYNGFGTVLSPLGTDWRLYKLDFSRMTQRDFGYRSDALDTAHLYDIEWGVEASTIFDLWNDDVCYYD
jgi:hypothetical protein